MESRLMHGQNWLERAYRQLRNARRMFDYSSFAEACFFSQQAAEQALKGYPIFQGFPLERIHSVETLNARCAQEDADFLDCTEAAVALNSLYMDTRYPDSITHEFIDYEMEEGQRALEHANRIVSLVQSKISAARTN